MKHKKKWKPTLLSVLVLLLLIAAMLGFFDKQENPLLNEKNAITLYMEIDIGEEPDFKTKKFFSEKEVDESKVSYDTSGCDVNVPGVYEIPVLYEGNKTNCVVQLTVCGEETVSQTGSGQSFSAAE